MNQGEANHILAEADISPLSEEVFHVFVDMVAELTTRMEGFQHRDIEDDKYSNLYNAVFHGVLRGFGRYSETLLRGYGRDDAFYKIYYEMIQEKEWFECFLLDNIYTSEKSGFSMSDLFKAAANLSSGSMRSILVMLALTEEKRSKVQDAVIHRTTKEVRFSSVLLVIKKVLKELGHNWETLTLNPNDSNLPSVKEIHEKCQEMDKELFRMGVESFRKNEWREFKKYREQRLVKRLG